MSKPDSSTVQWKKSVEVLSDSTGGHLNHQSAEKGRRKCGAESPSWRGGAAYGSADRETAWEEAEEACGPRRTEVSGWDGF